ncbi:ABC transporter ATP-binding protein [Roseiconus sp. JC912]
MARLEAENLSLRYDGDEVVRNVNLRVTDNQITSLIGPNGSGKSTLLRGLARLLPPNRGTVKLDGKSIERMRSRDVAKTLSLLSQKSDAPEGLTVSELVAFGRYPHRSWLGYFDRSDRRAVDEAMEVVGIETLANFHLGELSGGQRQMAWIAMNVAQQSPIMLLDEPTTFLDLSNQLEILHLLQTLQTDFGKTIVMVLHDINHAARFSHQMVALRDGVILYQGPPDEVLTCEMLNNVFDIEAEIADFPPKLQSTHSPSNSIGRYCIPLRHRSMEGRLLNSAMISEGSTL